MRALGTRAAGSGLALLAGMWAVVAGPRSARAEGDPFGTLSRLIAPPSPAELPPTSLPPELVGAPPVLLADNIITGPTPQQAATQPVDQPNNGVQRTLAEFVGHFAPYQPMYFVAGPVDPLVRFQLSFKYRLFNPDSPIGKIPVIGDLDFAYTQLSLWALTEPSAPFYDTNYQPEAFYNDDNIQWAHIPGVSQLGLMAGFGHDSNGQAGSISRQLNIVFVQPTFNFGNPEAFHFYVSPKAYYYIGDLSQNPDIAYYRGYVDARFVAGWKYGLEASVVGRVGSHGNKGSVLLDLTYPLRDLLDKNVDLYLDAQYFNGYGEVLREYNTRQNEFRIGFALVR
jgi:outer membrane phospholipase A